MKFLMSIYGDDEKWSSLDPDELAELIRDTDAHNAALFASGELLGAYGVADPVQARRVRVEGGVPVVTDGPYLEAKEHLGSFYVVDCEDFDRALEIAAEMPSARLTDIEVKQVLHDGAEKV